MSLINDALRRAKQAQQDTPPASPPSPHFRPIEPPAQTVRHGVGVMLPVSLALVALLALLLFWELSRRGSSSPQTQSSTPLNVSARVLAPAQATSAALEQTTPTAAANPTGTAKPLSDTPPMSVGSTTAPQVSSVPTTNLTTASSESSNTNAAPPAEPTPPPLKLQGIVYNPRRPSAMINGRVMFVGDRIRELKVTAIHAEDVVLVGGGHTNLLSLEP